MFFFQVLCGVSLFGVVLAGFPVVFHGFGTHLEGKSKSTIIKNQQG
jgi:hypothetical protein